MKEKVALIKEHSDECGKYLQTITNNNDTLYI